jgi:rhodanese-related sulfurtransferase
VTVPALRPDDVRAVLRARQELALIDVRPEAIFAVGHPLFAASVTLDRLEVDILDCVPRLSTPVVVYGEGGADEIEALRRLGELGYDDVHLLEGGLDGWREAGGELFADVNAPSKAFGELVALEADTPLIDPGDLRQLLDDDADVVVLDARRWDEYQAMSIPKAISVPGAELVRVVGAIAPDPSTLVVVQCAGRTRSLIGAQSLIDAGVVNPVVALRNGTIGWTLAGFSLEHGRRQAAPPVPLDVSRPAGAAARRVAAAAGVDRITADDLENLRGDSRRTVYRFDVRSGDEFVLGHVPGFRPVAGGQLVQETDRYAPVRGAVIVLSDDDGVRADMTAAWLAQMGWNVAVLEPTPLERVERGEWHRHVPLPPAVNWLPAELVAKAIEDKTAVVVDVDSSTRYRTGHIPGSLWARRSPLSGLQGRVSLDVARTPAIVVTSHDDVLTAFACRDLALATSGHVAGLRGGTGGWLSTGRPLEPGPGTQLCPATDVYRRPYEGTDVDSAAMQAYLEWEYGLVAQLRRDDTHGFWVGAARR